MKLKNQIVSWLKKQVKNAGAKGIVIGLSGGVDSSLAAVLCRGAVGESLLGVIMPCHSGSGDASDALMLAREFNIRTTSIDLAGPYDKLMELYPQGGKMAHSNIKPRLRMITLYYFANSLNYLVCGTGNKSELMTGYFTKYGDGGVDILPLGGLLKTEVWQLARETGVPGKIVDKIPSAGLWNGQTDEGEMGITYKELDGFLSGARGKMSKRGKAEVVRKMIERSKHKLSLPRIFQKE